MHRFESRLLDEDDDLRKLIRYAHLNPLRGGVVENATRLERYRWSSYPALLGHRAAFAFESVDRALAVFGEHPRESRRSLRAWMSAGAEDQGASEGLEHSDVPVPATLHAAPDEPAVGATGCEAELGSIDDLIERVTRHFLVAAEELGRGGRSGRACRARAVIAFVAVVRWRVPASRVAGLLGVSTRAICQALERGARIAAEEDLARPPRVSKSIS